MNIVKNLKVSNLNKTTIHQSVRNKKISIKLSKSSTLRPNRRKKFLRHSNFVDKSKNQKRPFSAVSNKAHDMAQRIITETELMLNHSSLSNRLNSDENKTIHKVNSDYDNEQSKLFMIKCLKLLENKQSKKKKTSLLITLKTALRFKSVFNMFYLLWGFGVLGFWGWV